jgi:RNA polymerase sigma factor (TIGR02999 family)
MTDQTQWLNASPDSRHGEMFGVLYEELKKIARSRMRGESASHTLCATALVHEAWLRLERSSPREWRNRGEFYGMAAEAMRRILVESARRRLARKRGSGVEDLPLEEWNLPVTTGLPDDRLLEVHEVLDRLEAEDETKARIVKLRFFGGLNHDEIAALLGVNEKTVRRHWMVTKIWLYRALGEKI